MNGTPAAKARRNLARTYDRKIWHQAHNEKHPMRYRLHCHDGTYNLKCDRITLLADMMESKPFMIERIERLPAGRIGQEGLAAATQLHDDSLRSGSPSELRIPVWLVEVS